MQVKDWTYEEFPEYKEEIEGAVRIPSTGEKIGIYYRPDIEYARIGENSLHLQILEPFTRNEPDRLMQKCLHDESSIS